MQNYILYSDVDQAIIDRSGNQAPSPDKRVRAINSELDALQAEYDLFDAVREKVISVATDGKTAYDVSVLVSDNDVKTIKDFNLGVDENGGSPIFTYLDFPAFTRKVEGGGNGNYYTLYTVNGVQKLRVLTFNPSATPVSITMSYHTTFKALDGDNDFIPQVINNVAGIKVLLPARFKELVAIGALIRLFYPAIGEDAMKYLSLLKSEYSDMKELLGLTVAKSPSRVERKFHLRKQY